MCSSRTSKYGGGSCPVPSSRELSRLPIEHIWCYFELALLGTNLGDPHRYAAEIKELNSYYGYLAWAEMALRSKARMEWVKGVDILQELIRRHPTAPEAYLRLWDVHYHRLKDHDSALEVIEQAFIKASDSDFKVLIALKYAKSLHKLQRFDVCFEILQSQYLDHQSHIGFIYLYSRLAVKSEDLKMRCFAINGLREVLLLGGKQRWGLAHYWLAKAYLLGRETSHAVTAFQQAILHLPSREARKAAEIRVYLSQMTSFISSFTDLQTISAFKHNSESAVKAQNCRKIAEMSDKTASDLEYSKVLFNCGMQSSALALIREVCLSQDAVLDPLILQVQMMKKRKNYERMREEAEELIRKSGNFPTFQWTKAVILYGKSLVFSGEPEKAVLALKCIGKVFPPVAQFPYISQIQRSHTVPQLSKTLFSGSHLFRLSPNASFANLAKDKTSLLQEVMQTSNREIAALYEPRPTPSTHESPSVFQRSFRNNPGNLTLDNSDLDIYRGTFMSSEGFAYSSDPVFLYKIGKIAYSSNTSTEDGIAALKDFLLVLDQIVIGFDPKCEKLRNSAVQMYSKLTKDITKPEV